MPETTPDRCITPSFSPSTYYHGKLMDGEVSAAGLIYGSALFSLNLRFRRSAISAWPRRRTTFGSITFGPKLRASSGDARPFLRHSRPRHPVLPSKFELERDEGASKAGCSAKAPDFCTP